MRLVVRLILLALFAGILALAWTFVPQDLDAPPAEGIAAPATPATAGVEIHAILAGKMLSSAGFAYRGGNLTEERVFNMGAILIVHPRGTLVFDSGFGKNVAEHFKTTPWLMQTTARYEQEPTVAEQLAAASITPSAILLTHAHWDHVSGLEDLPNIPVLVPQAERDFVDNGGEATALARQLGTTAYKVYDFPNGPYLGFEKSYDYFGDGSVVLVPAPGHTPGSIFAFINTSDGKHYVLIGDTAWQSEGIDHPAEKPWLARNLVDNDAEQVRGLLVRLHQLKEAIPGLVVVPAHDRRIWETLPQLKEATPSPPQ